MPTPPTELTTSRLYLRPYRPGDGEMYFHMLQDNRQHLYEFLPPSYLEMQGAEDAEARIQELQVKWAERELFIFGVWEKDSGNYLGEAYLANADWQAPHIEVGYFLVQSATGVGYATEAARAMLRYAFEVLGVERVELQCQADNDGSRHVAERCGFTDEGRMRQRHRKKDGRLVDVLWYGLLREEWESGGASSLQDSKRETIMNMQSHILSALREQFEVWEALLSGMSEAQVLTPLPESEWRPKDVVAHLYAWQQRSVARLQAALDGGEPRLPQWLPGVKPDTQGVTDRINTWLYKNYRDMPWAELHEKWRAQYLHLVELSAQLSEPALLDSSRYAWLDGYSPADVLLGTYDHHQEHFEALIA